MTLEVKNGIATVTFSRPEIANALDDDMCADLLDLWPKVSEDKDIRVVVLTGAGKNFCAGGNIAMFRERLDNQEYLTYDNLIKGGQMSTLMKKCKKPIIAMVNGAAVGAGTAFALGADFRVMSPKSRFGMGFIGLGLSGDSGANYSLAKIVGPSKALELMMLGDVIKGDKCYELGIANFLSEEDNLEEVTYKLAAKLAAGPTFAYACQKEILYRFFYNNFNDYIEGEGDTMPACFKSKDFDEAVNAFIQKRPPVFIGE
ncbi:MAG: enoyl-CoA hydratase/isomerase family protein [Oscillospiraceae bacterium]